MAVQGQKSGELTDHQLEALNAISSENSMGEKQLDAFEAARRSGLSYLYSTVYRGMSFVAAHPTLASTNAMMEERDNGFGLKFAPSDTQMEFCLGLVETCLATGSKHFDPLLSNQNRHPPPCCVTKAPRERCRSQPCAVTRKRTFLAKRCWTPAFS